MFISEDKKTITLPVPLDTIVYRFHTSCNDACLFQQKNFDKVFPRGKEGGRCSGDMPCHTKLHSVLPKELNLSNLEWILKDWNVYYFETEKEAREAGEKLIETHKQKLLELGLKIVQYEKEV